MHPNPVFHTGTDETNAAFARSRGFGVLAVATQGAPHLSHVPFLLSEGGQLADLHLVRSNPIARALSSTPSSQLSARIAVSGPNTYISPDWYEVPDQVPTWNYVAVHLTGVLELRPQEELRALLDRQSAFYEAQLDPKPRWTTAKMTPDALTKMMRQIVPCLFRVEQIEGTWKLNQNKPGPVREAAAEQVDAFGFGSDVRALAALMRGV